MHKSSQKKVNPFLIFLLILTIGFVGSLYLINQPTKELSKSGDQTYNQLQPTFTPIPTKPAPTPTRLPKPIPSGKRKFQVSVSSNHKGPKMGEGTIDPYDPKTGSIQKLTIDVGDTVPVEKVTATMKTDNQSTPTVELKLISGSNKSGTWGGEWTINDSYNYTYILTINALSANGSTTVDFTLR